MSISSFYNKFHKNSSFSTKIINETNFTYRIIIDGLKNITNQKKLNILDFGCGVGSLDFYYANSGHNIVGVDISKIAIQVANNTKKQFPHLSNNIAFMNSENFDVFNQKNKFDLIICSEVIEHVDSDYEYIKMFHTLLKKGGFLFLTTPSVKAPLYKMGLLESFDREVGHLRRYDQKTLYNLLNKHKFKVKDLKITEGIIRNSLFTIKSLGMINKIVKGFIADFVTYFDDISIGIFGGSNFHILAQKV